MVHKICHCCKYTELGVGDRGIQYILQRNVHGVGEMIRDLSHAALAKDPSQVSSTHTGLLTIAVTDGSHAFFWILGVPALICAHLHAETLL